MNDKFNLDTIDKTVTKYKKNEIFDGVVVLKRMKRVMTFFNRNIGLLFIYE